MNLFVSCKVKRCNLSLSTGLITVPAVPFLLARDHFTFPASLLWLGAHLTPIKTSTFKSKSCIGAGWKSIFFPPLYHSFPFFSSNQKQIELSENAVKSAPQWEFWIRERGIKCQSKCFTYLQFTLQDFIIRRYPTDSVHVGMVLKDCCYLP